MIEDFYQLDPYELGKEQKEAMLLKELIELTQHHDRKCEIYHRILESMEFEIEKVKNITEIPFLPVRLFKEAELLSISKDKIFKVMTSSGTTGQAVSKIFTDQETAMIQQKVMIKILSNYLGKKRLPVLIVDTQEVVKNRNLFSARGAAIIGLNVMAKEMSYVLNTDMSLNVPVLEAFMEKHQGEKILIFGFTFLVWQHFYKKLCEMDRKFDMSQAWLMTGGGWKKLESEKISREQFKQAFRDVCGIGHFLDHYGMVEQTGCIYAECEYGHLHSSIYSDVIPRRYQDFSPCEIGEEGILQVVSALPHSYPGHSLLTEDQGMVLGEDDCPCGRKGKYIQITGRIKNAELRGCSDTYAANGRF